MDNARANVGTAERDPIYMQPQTPPSRGPMPSTTSMVTPVRPLLDIQQRENQLNEELVIAAKQAGALYSSNVDIQDIDSHLAYNSELVQHMGLRNELQEMMLETQREHIWALEDRIRTLVGSNQNALSQTYHLG